MKGPSVVHPVPHVFHLRDTLALALLAGRLLRRPPPFAPPESGQNLHHGLATILGPPCGLLLVLVRLLQTRLYDRLSSEVILLANPRVGVVARDMGCATTTMAFEIPLLFRRPWFIPMSQDLMTAFLIIPLYLYDPLHLIFHLVSVGDNASLNVDFLELHRIDTLNPKLLEVNFDRHS